MGVEFLLAGVSSSSFLRDRQFYPKKSLIQELLLWRNCWPGAFFKLKAPVGKIS
jgi:hypothetical protein